MIRNIVSNLVVDKSLNIIFKSLVSNQCSGNSQNILSQSSKLQYEGIATLYYILTIFIAYNFITMLVYVYYTC